MASISPRTPTERAALIHREVVQLIALVFVAVVAFLVTSAVATNNRDLSVRNAAEWYRRGEQFVHAGRLDDAVDAFRRATVRNRTNRTYLMALSRALAQKHDYDSARSLLLTVRASAPEDPEVNLDLARLSAARQDVTEAIRFFHDALYASWPQDDGGRRRAVRLELIRFLLTHNDPSRAQSELLAAAVDMPDNVVHHVELAELFNEAGDARNALAHFQRALRLEPQNAEALVGAGKAAFDIGLYQLARRYLHEVPGDAEATSDVRHLVDLVLSRDPLAARIGAHDRRDRLLENLSYVEQRLTDCLGQDAVQPASTDARALQSELQTFQQRVRRSPMFDQDTIEAGVDLVDRIELNAITACGSPTVTDRALLLIAHQHGAVSQ